MIATLAALALLSLPADPEDFEGLPTALTLDDPPAFRRHRRRQQEDTPQRPPNLDAARLRPEEPEEVWTLTLSPTVRLVRGTTRVRENSSTPEWLNLKGDFGLDATAGVRVALTHESGPILWFLEVDLSLSQGRGRFGRDFSYDEDNFKGGVPYKTSASLFFSRAGIALPGALWERRDGRISPFIGLEYVRMSVGIEQPSLGIGTSEQYEQFMPYPIAGVASEIRLSPDLILSGRLYGGGLPNVPTPFAEGGRLYMRVKTIGADVQIAWQASESVRLVAGVGYQFWSGRLLSGEDGNEFQMSAPLVTLGIEFTF